MNQNFWRSDITYGVKKDQNVKSHFWLLMFFSMLWFLMFWSTTSFLMFWSIKKRLSMFWSFSIFWSTFRLSTFWFLTFWSFHNITNLLIFINKEKLVLRENQYKIEQINFKAEHYKTRRSNSEQVNAKQEKTRQ